MNNLALDLDLTLDLYRTHADDLRAVCRERRAQLTHDLRLRPQLDDVEAELTYLYLRHLRPTRVVEIGTFHGWSTSWILSALRDNDHGHLDSYDLVDHARQHVPDTLAHRRWTFHHTDVRAAVGDLPDPDFLFVDADHGRRFGRWYLAELLPRLRPGTPVSVHDVFHLRWSRPWTEGREVMRCLDRNGREHFTAARRRAPDTLDHLEQVRRELRIPDTRGTRTNPMIWFRAP